MSGNQIQLLPSALDTQMNTTVGTVLTYTFQNFDVTNSRNFTINLAKNYLNCITVAKVDQC